MGAHAIGRLNSFIQKITIFNEGAESTRSPSKSVLRSPSYTCQLVYRFFLQFVYQSVDSCRFTIHTYIPYINTLWISLYTTSLFTKPLVVLRFLPDLIITFLVAFYFSSLQAVAQPLYLQPWLKSKEPSFQYKHLFKIIHCTHFYYNTFCAQVSN